MICINNNAGYYLCISILIIFDDLAARYSVIECKAIAETKYFFIKLQNIRHHCDNAICTLPVGLEADVSMLV